MNYMGCRLYLSKVIIRYNYPLQKQKGQEESEICLREREVWLLRERCPLERWKETVQGS